METEALTANVFDIDYHLNWVKNRADRKPWDRLTSTDAENDLLYFDQSPTEEVQEYETTDRDGHPLRIALVITSDLEAHQTEDLGTVYEIAL